MSDQPLSPLSFAQVRAIVGTADEASLTRAGERLGVSQSSLSRQIAGAERVLGHRLFQRGWGGMAPTSAGAVVIAHCRRMRHAIDEAEQSLAGISVRPRSLGRRLTWRLLDAVEAVRIAGSVSAAAVYLGISQPEVSRALGRMAAAVGMPLFRRSAIGMVADDAVPILDRLRRRLRAEAAALPQALTGLHGALTGRLAVGLLPFSEQDIVTRAFGVLLREHRHIQLQAVTGSYSALIEALRRGELDLILGTLRDRASFDDLQEIHLHDELLTLVARSAHPALADQPMLDALTRETWVVAPRDTPTRRYLEHLLLDHGLTPPAHVCEMVTFPLAEQMVLDSDSIGLLSYSPRKRAGLRAGLVGLSLELPDRRRRIGVTCLAGDTLPAVIKLFIALLRQDLSPATGHAEESAII